MKLTRIILYILITQYLFSANFTGQVTDVEGKPLENVNIYTLTTGTETDSTGIFTIEIKSGDIITISHIGYQGIKYAHSDIPKTILLHPSYSSMNQILVNGILEYKSLGNISKSLTIIDPQEDNSIYTSMSDYINSVPNINYISGTSQPRYFRIRGIGEISQFAGEGAPIFSVSYYIDDIDLSGIGTIGNNFAMDRTQIYKGSQNLMYGYNSLAGAISSYSAEPAYYRSGLIKLGVGAYGSYEAGLSYSLPFSKKIHSILTMHKNYSNGYMENNYLDIKNSNQIDENLIRYKALWIPAEKYNSKLTIMYYNNNNNYDIWTPDNNTSTTYTDSLGTDKVTVFGISWINNIKIENAIYKTTISSTKSEVNYGFDADWGNNNYWLGLGFNPSGQGYDWSFYETTKRTRDIASLDIKRSENFNSMNVIIGIYLNKIKEIDKKNTEAAFPLMYDGAIDSMHTIFDINSYSFYGSIEHSFKSFKLSYGARYDNNLLSYDGKYYLGQELERELPLNFESQGLSAAATLSHTLNDILSHYINLSSSFKPGGVNQTFLIDESHLKYEKESAFSLEYGFHVNTKKFTSKTSFFITDRTSPQVKLYYQPDPNNPVSFDYFTTNANSGFVSGLEFQANAFVNKNISISQDIGIQKSTINEYINPLDGATYQKRETAHSPRYNFKTSATYTKNNLDASIIITGLDGFYYDDQVNEKSSPYSLTHFNISYTLNNIKIGLWSKNIFDKKYPVRGYIFDLGIVDGENVPITEENSFISGANLYKAYGAPRTFGLSLTYTF